MKRKITFGFLLIGLLLTVTSCGGTKENNTEIPTESEVVKSEPLEEKISTEANSKTTEQETEKAEDTVPEEVEASPYTYTDMSVVMYAQSAVNVRDLPSTDGNVVSSLSTNNEVAVTGQCKETGWYRFELNGGSVYVSNDFLGNEKVEIAPPTEASSSEGGSNNSGDSNGARYIRYGEIDEEWLLSHGWLYDASKDLIYPTDDTKNFFNQWEGKTIAEAEAEIGMGISMQGPWGESVSLGSNLKNIPIGTYYGIVDYAGHKLQMPF